MNWRSMTVAAVVLLGVTMLGPAQVVRAQRFVEGGGRLPQRIMDSKGNQWSIYPGGWLQQNMNLPNGGGYQFYNQGAMLMINGGQLNMNNQAAQTDPKTGELILENQPAQNGLQITRRILVNKDEAYVRYVDIFRNTQNQEQNVTIGYSSSFNYGINMPQMVEDPKRKGQNLACVAMVPINIGQPIAIMEMYGGKGAKTVPSITVQPNNNNSLQASLQVSIGGGKQVALMHLHAITTTPEAGATFIKQLKESKLLVTIPPAIRKLIINFPAGQAFVGDTEILRGEVFDVVETRGGDQFRGTLQEPSYKLETFYGQVELPVERVIGLINVGTFRPRQLVITSDGEMFGGQLKMDSVKLQLSSGQVTQVPLAQISRLGYRKRSGEPEEWTFTKPLVIMRSGDRMMVQMPTEKIDVATRYGVLKLDPTTLGAISFQSEEHGIHDIYLADGSHFAGLVSAQQFEMKLANNQQTIKFPAASLLRLQLNGKVPEIDDSTPTIELANNDVLVGTLKGQLKLVTAFDTLTLNAGEVRKLTHTAGSTADVQVKMWDDTSATGQLDVQDLECTLNCGLVVKVPVTLLSSYSQPQPVPSTGVSDKIKALVAELGAEDWKQRDRAESELVQMGAVVAGMLKQLKSTQSPEAQQRIDSILKQVEKENKPAGGSVEPMAQPPMLEDG